MSSGRRARRNRRAHNFGARHPRLTLVIVGALIAGVVAICAEQLSYGTYLGRGWEIAALSGMVTAAGLGAAVVITNRRHSPAARLVTVPYLVLSLVSVSAIRYPFPQGPYGGVQAFFNVAKAFLLGYEAVTLAAVVALFTYLLLRPGGLARKHATPNQAVHAPGLRARLRFPGAKAATWRAGRLIAANGTVTWLSLNGDAEVDLTSACQALPMRLADGRGRQPRKTTLATARGLAEVDVSPTVLSALVGGIQRPPYDDPAQ